MLLFSSYNGIETIISPGKKIRLPAS